MSGPMYAGQLCATQVGGQIDTTGEHLRPLSPYLVCVQHGGGSTRLRRANTVRVVLRNPVSHQQWPEVLDHDHVVTVENPA